MYYARNSRGQTFSVAEVFFCVSTLLRSILLHCFISCAASINMFFHSSPLCQISQRAVEEALMDVLLERCSTDLY